jgi:hypothetical protein
MKPSMWYLDDNRWEAGQQQQNKLNAHFLFSQLIQELISLVGEHQCKTKQNW